MRVMIDTNIFISAALFPNGRTSQALMKALLPPFQPVTCDYVVDELHRKFQEKFPERITELEAFLYSAMDVIGAENYEGEDKYPHFSLFKKNYETDRWQLYGTYMCDGKEKSTHLSKGDYTLYSPDLGKYEFSVDDLEREYTIVVDYDNKVLDFH